MCGGDSEEQITEDVFFKASLHVHCWQTTALACASMVSHENKDSENAHVKSKDAVQSKCSPNAVMHEPYAMQ